MTTPDQTALPEGMVRPEVYAFALLMEQQLRANDHKPGWKNDDPFSLHQRVEDEVKELRRALVGRQRAAFNPPETGRQSVRVALEAADVANMAMMVADVCEALAYTPRPDTDRTSRDVGEGWATIATAPRDGTPLLLIDANAATPEASSGYFWDGVWSCVEPNSLVPATAIMWQTPTHWRYPPTLTAALVVNPPAMGEVERLREALESARGVLTLIRRGASPQAYDLTGCIERASDALAPPSIASAPDTSGEPQVVQRSGGWFVTGESWSGPWSSEEAAELAMDGEYTLAHDLERQRTTEDGA